MKAFLIDPAELDVTEIVIDDWRGITSAIGEKCQCFTVVPTRSLGNNDTIYVDDEGLINRTFNEVGGFEVDDYPNPLVGRGVVLGVDRGTGDSVDATTTREEILSKVNFIPANSYGFKIRHA